MKSQFFEELLPDELTDDKIERLAIVGGNW
jgi:hypothetical protein